MDKTMKKICQQEMKTLKLLEAQQNELEKAMKENKNFIEATLLTESKHELKLKGEIQELTKRTEKLRNKLQKVSKTKSAQRKIKIISLYSQS